MRKLTIFILIIFICMFLFLIQSNSSLQRKTDKLFMKCDSLEMSIFLIDEYLITKNVEGEMK